MTDTKTRILDSAERLTQINGFNGFSYIDLAEEIGIKTSSIHYHFKVKADLAMALVERTHESHNSAFKDLDLNLSKPEKRLSTMIGVFEEYMAQDKFCLCGMLSAELQSVSPEVRQKLKSYFNDMRVWVAKQLQEMGQQDPSKKALSFVSTLEGSLLLARLHRDSSIIRDAMGEF